MTLITSTGARQKAGAFSVSVDGGPPIKLSEFKRKAKPTQAELSDIAAQQAALDQKENAALNAGVVAAAASSFGGASRCSQLPLSPLPLSPLLLSPLPFSAHPLPFGAVAAPPVAAGSTACGGVGARTGGVTAAPITASPLSEISSLPSPFHQVRSRAT